MKGCNKKYFSKYLLQKHLQSHQGNNTFCKICNIYFGNRILNNRHRAEFHVSKDILLVQGFSVLLFKSNYFCRNLQMLH